MLKKNEVYNPNLYRKEIVVPSNRNLSINQAISFAKRHGFVIIDPDGVVT